MPKPIDSERLELLARIAALYFEDGLTQAQVASQTGYSRSMVSRLLTEARQQEVVEIRVHHPVGRRTDLEQSLQERLGLRGVRVLARETLSHTQMLRRLGSLAARLVEELVEDHTTVGLSWGTAMFEMVHALRPRSYTDLHVVQLIGALSTSDDPEIDGPELARRLARAFGGRYSILPAPLFVDSESTREALLNDHRVQRVLAYAEDMALALVGIGTMDTQQSSLVRAGYLNPAQIRELTQAGVVGEVCAIHYDRAGQIVETSLTRRAVGISRSALAGIPARVGVAGGPAKALPILGAVRAGLVNIMVTDQVAAIEILRELESPSGPPGAGV